MLLPKSKIRKNILPMPLVHVKRNFQITLPQQLRNALEIKEGDLMEAEIRENTIILKPKTIIDKAKLDTQKQTT